MPQAGLVRRDDGTLQVALQRIEKYPRNENQCRRSGRYPPPAGRPIAPAGTAVRSLARCPYPADTAGQVAHRAIVGRDHNADAPPAWSRVRTSPDHPPPPGYRRTRVEIPGMDGFTPLACSAAAQSSPLLVTATPPPSSRDSVSTTASSHCGPPRMLLELWPTTTAERHIGANCRQPRSRSSSNSTPLRSSRQRAQGDRAVTRAACTDTFSGTIAHHSASGTTSLPTMNMPIRACQPQLSLCVTTCPESGCSPSCLSAGSALLSNVPAAVTSSRQQRVCSI